MCDIDQDDFERPAVWSQRTVKARKRHTCRCCGGFIEPGETYTRHFDVTGGYVTHEVQCSACTEMVAEFEDEHGTYTSPSSMPELVEECMRSGDKDAWRWAAHLNAMDARRAKAKLSDCEDVP